VTEFYTKRIFTRDFITPIIINLSINMSESQLKFSMMRVDASDGEGESVFHTKPTIVVTDLN
jgi:hypothetical protein